MKTFLFIISLYPNIIFSQYITGLNVKQSLENQIKANLKVYLPTVSEFLSSNIVIEQNIITIYACYFMTDFGGISNLDNNFIVDIPNNGNYTLNVKMYSSGSSTDCSYESLEDTVSINFTTPIEGTISLNSSELTKKSITFYPNPTKDILNMETKEKIEKVNIYDYSGKLMMKSNDNAKKINVSDLGNGIYFIEILTNSKKLYKEKFLIQK